MDLGIEHRPVESVDERELNRAEQGDQPQAMGYGFLDLIDRQAICAEERIDSGDREQIERKP